MEMAVALDVLAYFSDYNTAINIEAPEIQPTATPVTTDFGNMDTYKSTFFPFEIQYPADWVKQPAMEGMTASFAYDEGVGFVIAEEDLTSSRLKRDDFGRVWRHGSRILEHEYARL